MSNTTPPDAEGLPHSSPRAPSVSTVTEDSQSFTDAHSSSFNSFNTDNGQLTPTRTRSINELSRQKSTMTFETSPETSSYSEAPLTPTSVVSAPPPVESSQVASQVTTLPAPPMDMGVPLTTLPVTNVQPLSEKESNMDTIRAPNPPVMQVESKGATSESSSSFKDEKIAIEEENLKHLNEEQRRAILLQSTILKPRKISLKDLFRYTTRFELLLNFFGLIFAIVAGSSQPALALIFGNLTSSFSQYGLAVNQGLPTDQLRDALFDTIDSDALTLVYIGIGVALSFWFFSGVWVWTGEKATRRIREAYLKAVLRQNIAFFDKLGAGEVATRIESDTHLIQEGISEKMSIIVFFFSTFVSGFIIAFIRAWRLALAESSVVPVIAGVGALMAIYSMTVSLKKAQLDLTAQGGTQAEEIISSIRTVQAFSIQKRLAALFNVFNSQAGDLGKKMAIRHAAFFCVFMFIVYGAWALGFFYGSILIVNGDNVPGEIVSVIMSVLIASFSLAQVAPLVQAVQYAISAASKIYATIDRIPSIDSADPSGLKPEKVMGEFKFTNTSFYYPSRPTVKVLSNFNAHFPFGKTTALVGASGSGKSTIIGLIERFYDPIGGQIELDGIPLDKLNLKWLRSQIGLVSQMPTLFATTISGNVSHGLINTEWENAAEDTKQTLIEEACKQANAHSFIMALPDGYNTHIGERGLLISGGQAQRLAIARAIVSNPKILLLDEATSALDSTSENIVQEMMVDALDKASANRTCIVVAHRLSTIKNANQIIVMNNGEIIEVGNHNELIKKPNGAYARLCTAQKIREETEETRAAEDNPGLDEKVILDDEKIIPPEDLDPLGALKRSATGKSAVSSILSRKRQEDAARRAKNYGFFYLFWRMGKLNREEWPSYILGLFAAAVSGMVYPVFGIIFAHAIGIFSLPTSSEVRSGGNKYALYCFILAIITAIAQFCQNWTFFRTAEILSAKLRLLVLKSILRQDIAYFDEENHNTGALTTAVADHALKINGLWGITLGVICQSSITLIGGAVVGLVYAPKIAAVGIATIPVLLSGGVSRLYVVRTKDAQNKKSHEESAQLGTEAAAGIRTVVSLTREDDVLRLYSQLLEKPERVAERAAIYSNALYGFCQSVTFFVIALVFWYGSRQMINDGLSPTSFFVALMSVIFGSIQAGNVFSFVPDMSQAKGAAAAVVELTDQSVEVDADSTKGEVLPECSGHLVFQDIHFRYPTRTHIPVLRGLNFEVKPGQFVALVGASGCGKSTAIQLTEHFYSPLAGRITLDGKDISTLNINSYRSHLALVSQTPNLYSGTLRENVAMGSPKPLEEVTDEEVMEACRSANIHDFIMSLPDQYSTQAGTKGAQLSGGQLQRICIARALIRHPKVLLLDEATSALDSESEKVVQKALDQAAKGRSTIAIAHRLNTIQDADCIYVLKDGQVAEKGRHNELLGMRGIYFELVQQQDLEKNN